MKKIVYIFIIAAGVLVLSSAEHKSAGPPGCFAGEPPNNTNCTNCHTEYAVNTGSATITFDVGGAETGYVPGVTYDVNISVSKAAMQAAGFQFTVLRDNNSGVTPGTITLTDVARTQKVDQANPHVQGCGLLQKEYVEHTYQGINSDANGKSLWSFKWKAPDTSVGNITFYLATVQSNYSGDEFGDYVYTKKITSKGPANGINSISGTNGINIFPNPASTVLYVDGGANKIGQIELKDMQGAVARHIDATQSPHNQTYAIDLNGLHPGMYFVCIQSETGNTIRKIIVQ